MLLADLESKRGVQIDVENVLRIAILHDLAESLTFDISRAYLEYMGPKGGAMKREIERTAWQHIAEGIKERGLAREYWNLQKQYLADKSHEAKIVHAADSIDILLQVVNYERRGYPSTLLSNLWNERVKMVRNSEVPSAQVILNLIIAERRKSTARRKIT